MNNQFINRDQQKAAFAFIGSMAIKTGCSSVDLYARLKEKFILMSDIDFSLKLDRCEIWEYNLFMEWLYEAFVFLTADSNMTPAVFFQDIEKYLIKCIKLRTCCICGAIESDIHETSAIGMGNNRSEVDRTKYPRMSLCREHHNLAHSKGQEWFNNRFHVFGVYCKYHPTVKDSIDQDLEGGVN